MSSLRARAIWPATADPTVPRPARPTLSGATIECRSLVRTASAPRSERNNVVQRFRPGFKETPDIAGSLTDALLVFHQCDAHEAFTVFAKADARRDRDLGLFHQEL